MAELEPTAAGERGGEGLVTEGELGEFEDRLDDALKRRSTEGLDVIGYGEVSVALRLATSRGDFVCKRLVPFGSKDEAERAAQLIGIYIERLGECGIEVVPTDRLILERPAGHVLYCVQSFLPAASLGPSFMRDKSIEEAEPYIVRIFEHIRDSVSPTLAPDGQLSNWVIEADRIRYLDVGTPFMRDERGRSLFDFRSQTRALPQPIRTIVDRFMLKGILDNYHSTRGQALDFLGNLIKEGLGDLLAPLVPVANHLFELSPPITEKEVRAHYKSDAQSYAFIQAARRADRWVHEALLGKHYPYLLPPKIQRHG